MDDEKYQWSKEDTLKLIKLYKSFPYLWDSSLPDHRDKAKRSSAMNKIAKDFKTSVPEIQRKLHNLRCSFNQEIRRLKGKRTFSNWEYFDSMYFVAGQHKRRSFASIPSSLELRSFKCEEAGDTNNSRNSVNDEIVVFNGLKNETDKTEKRKIDCMLTENDCSRNRICQIAKPQYDDNETFGNFVGSELRGLSCPYKRDDLKRMILQSILTVTDYTYVSPALKHLDAHADETSSTLHSIVSVESVNDSGLLNVDSINGHEFHVNKNVKLEI